MAKFETTLTLRSAIWNRGLRRSILNRCLTISANELEGKLKDNIDNSTPAGRLYKVGRVTARRSSANKYLPKARGTKTRVFVNAILHTASAIGQPPARLTSFLYKSIIVRKVASKFQILASANAPGASILDDPGKLSRPFFRTIIDAYRNNEFVDRVKQSISELLGPQ